MITCTSHGTIRVRHKCKWLLYMTSRSSVTVLLISGLAEHPSLLFLCNDSILNTLSRSPTHLTYHLLALFPFFKLFSGEKWRIIGHWPFYVSLWWYATPAYGPIWPCQIPVPNTHAHDQTCVSTPHERERERERERETDINKHKSILSSEV